MIEEEDDPICDVCRLEDETTEHIPYRCPAQEEERVWQGFPNITPYTNYGCIFCNLFERYSQKIL